MTTNYFQILSEILPKAGDIIMSFRPVGGNVLDKEHNEIVTSADIASNQYITTELKKLFPEIPIYTEESNVDKSESATRWIIDPLDGTTPWVWGNSGFSISIALEQDAQVVVGAVYDPVMKELFFAEKGKGATRNGVSIQTSSNIQSLKESLLVVDWGNKDGKREEGLTYFQSFFVPSMIAKRTVPQFAPALGLCHVAEGRIHGLVCNDTWVEDHAAGSLILQESHGYCTNFYHTHAFNLREPGIIATSNQTLHKELTAFLQKTIPSIV